MKADRACKLAHAEFGWSIRSATGFILGEGVGRSKRHYAWLEAPRARRLHQKTSDPDDECKPPPERSCLVGLRDRFYGTSLLAFLAHLEPRVSGRESKLARAIRAMGAARRKTIRRLETIRVETCDRVIVKWIPFDPKSGLRIKPDGDPAEVVHSQAWTKTS
jgi:hypothetical protein